MSVIDKGLADTILKNILCFDINSNKFSDQEGLRGNGCSESIRCSTN